MLSTESGFALKMLYPKHKPRGVLSGGNLIALLYSSRRSRK
jgi:hypothetical protein